MTLEQLTHLEERLQAAKGPDPVIDEMFCRLSDQRQGWYWDGASRTKQYWPTPTITASIDAALALVEKLLPGWHCTIESSEEVMLYSLGEIGYKVRAATVPLAILQALIGALSALKAKEAGDMPDKPIRVQRKRAVGWKMPPNTVYVGRPTKWGNPWTIAGVRTAGFTGADMELAEIAVGFFRNGVERGLPIVRFTSKNVQTNLRGKNLACWCRIDQPCHADVLLELANTPTEQVTNV